ncbi:hypothetical protein [Pseudomonas aeruginosa]|uniref:hypothetical protein n=1 Tax=Pseudomonas aeruginosa TaxID=287 RepID=UPI0021B4AE06|nr:hypothetical protein [Pseudomonas aeruginosa]MCT7418365.1 hypothetical protein [Pseudomonas aeruginosa]
MVVAMGEPVVAALAVVVMVAAMAVRVAAVMAVPVAVAVAMVAAPGTGGGGDGDGGGTGGGTGGGDGSGEGGGTGGGTGLEGGCKDDSCAFVKNNPFGTDKVPGFDGNPLQKAWTDIKAPIGQALGKITFSDRGSCQFRALNCSGRV